MRSLDYLIQLYPDKTGTELLEIQKQDKADDQKEYELLNAKKLEVIQDINSNGGYWKGVFGQTQYFFYSFSNLKMIQNDIFCDVETIVCFFEDNNRVSIKIENSTLREFENYGVSLYERVNKSEYEGAVNAILSIKNLFT